jgi:hypothetical protein
MRCVFFVCLIFITAAADAHTRQDSVMRELDALLKKKEEFVRAKEQRIVQYKAMLPHSRDQFTIFYKIYEQYKSFIYDSGFVYARKMQHEAYRNKDTVRIAMAKVKLAFVLLSSGMFNEALDSLNTIRARGLPDSLQAEYFSVLARTYYDLADFNRDQYYEAQYRTRGNLYIDSAIRLSVPGTVPYLARMALKNVKVNRWDEARAVLEEQMGKHVLADPDLAVAASTMGYIYMREGETRRAKHYLALAAMGDIRASTKETLAILTLAEVLYKEGEVKQAYLYVKQAMDDANFYGARHRKVQVASIFPKIEGDELNTVERQRRLVFLYAAAVTVLTLIIIVFAVIIFKQFKRLQVAKAAITEANGNLQEANARLVMVNGQLMEVNHKLIEANKIKEEYIGYYFNINTEYLEKIEAFRRSIDNKLMARKFDDIRQVVNNINIKKEREDLYFSFDKLFLKLFPDFVTIFNNYFKEEDRIVLKEGQLLNTELRIFALIRMGIHDTEKIAKILDYSINTIYNYKARIKNKSILPNEEFEKKIMEIQAL